MNDLPKFEDFLKQSLIGNKFTMYISDKKGCRHLITRKPARECKVQVNVEVIQVDVSATESHWTFFRYSMVVEINLILQSDSGKQYEFYDWDLNN